MITTESNKKQNCNKNDSETSKITTKSYLTTCKIARRSYQSYGSTYRRTKIDSGGVELIMTCLVAVE